MKRLKGESQSARRFKLSYFLLGVAVLYLILIFIRFPEFFETAAVLSGNDIDLGMDDLPVGDDEVAEISKSHQNSVSVDGYHLQNNENQDASIKPPQEVFVRKKDGALRIKPIQHQYGRITAEILKRMNRTAKFSVLEQMADEAWTLGLKAWDEVDKYDEKEIKMSTMSEVKPETCPSWVSVSGDELNGRDRIMFLPCGLAAGSSITVIGTPHYAHKEYVPQLAKLRFDDATVLVSQFMIELQGLKSVDGEDPPKILHLNPRLRGDWSHQPVIEHNTCYRMQWGTAQRCDGLPSKNDDDMLVDGYLRCEKWMRNDIIDTKESKLFSWFDRFIGRAKKPEVTWPFPFVEGRMFVLTIRAGVDGYHMNAGGRHMTSFPYRTGFILEDATGLAIKGDVDVHSVYATSLPTSHPSFSTKRVLEFLEKWKSQPIPQSNIQLFIGVLSATNHFAERMAIRKTWMQSSAIKSSKVAVRFFVALNPRKEVNAILKKEAAYFGDMVILPFMDRYELVVLKTIAICEYGVQNVTAAHIMKCDDDNFIRVDTVLKEIEGVPSTKPLYMGNLNLHHRPLRNGKWAVTYQEWPEEIYPPYANGPGYIISIDIAKYIVSQHANLSLRLFKMEDVSMGMWVEQFNSTKKVQYSHNWKFCQYGCMENYYTAHYQSPRQMVCLWDNLSKGRACCCNF
ncbi:hydroxyproline O-galactosyltransferase GALT2 [Olea europaea subsp. europaea]|uniref:Hydroxyproline O-galactosyltransferase GALT2 n=1 Tax=Olea europaea subsp. europaea TaxID=158383 RepID=A0A8S0RBG9_OLEEU|nr:hydroxyproline O-galactosyltransferase GALT2 [Olea europaea subsp. europaea]